MRALGYRTVDALVDWLSDDSRPPLRRATPAEMVERLGVAVPTAGAPFDEALAVLFDDVLPFTSRSSHPRFFAYVPFAGIGRRRRGRAAGVPRGREWRRHEHRCGRSDPEPRGALPGAEHLAARRRRLRRL